MNHATKEYNRLWREKNREHSREYQKQWRVKNRDKCRASQKKYHDSHQERMKAYRHSQKRRIRETTVARVYGLTASEYRELVEQQGDKCAICHKVEETGRLLSIDHSHITKRVRGLLCSRCNRGLGSFKDSVENLQRAVKYLQTS